MVFDICVIGCGVVGAALARNYSLLGCSTLIIEKNDNPISGASSGNSGIFHTGFDAKPGTLEGQLLKRGWKLFHELQKEANIPSQMLGALVIAWTDDEYRQLPEIVKLAHENKILDTKQITQEELFKMEPNLSKSAKGAVFVPQESIVDPFFVPIFYLCQAIARGCRLETSCQFIKSSFHSIQNQQFWEIETSKGVFYSKIIVNASGNFGDLVESSVRISPFKILPRKGEFVVYRPSTSFLTKHIILPVPTARTKGVLLFPSIYGDFLVGPTAEDQNERENPTTSEKTKEQLTLKGEIMLPLLKNQRERIINVYAGIRPATQFQDYQIEFLPDKNWISVSGIRSTGLSAALGIAEYVVENTKQTCKFFHFLEENRKSEMEEAKELVKELLYGYTNISLHFRGRNFQVSHPLPFNRNSHFQLSKY